MTLFPASTFNCFLWRLNPAVMNNDQEMTSFNPMPVSPSGASVRGVPAGEKEKSVEEILYLDSFIK